MNGHTRESKHRIAVLEDEDVETFVAFCEYAYTGNYNLPRRELESEDHSPEVIQSPQSSANWRASYRTGSVSPRVPPPAPTPPPAPSPPPGHRRHRYGSMSASTYEESQPDTLVPDSHTSVPENAAERNEEAREAVQRPREFVQHAIADYEEAEAEIGEPPEDDEPPVEFPEVTIDPLEVPKQWELEQPSPKSMIARKEETESKKADKAPEAPVETDLPSCEPGSLTPPITPPVEGKSSAAPESKPEVERPAGLKWPEQPAEEWRQLGPSSNAAAMEDSWTEDRVNSQKPILDMSFAQQSASSPCEPGLSLWDEFARLRYNDLPRPEPPQAPRLPYLTFHAKVYVFATRYLIPALAQLCLRKLHADLLALPEEPIAQAQVILDLVHYAYTKTARLEPISPTSATQLRKNELRRLVVHYAACKVKELARYHADSVMGTPELRPADKVASGAPRSLRSLLDMTTELASDLVYRMM